MIPLLAAKQNDGGKSIFFILFSKIGHKFGRSIVEIE
jgi:hypothetical protein